MRMETRSGGNIRASHTLATPPGMNPTLYKASNSRPASVSINPLLLHRPVLARHLLALLQQLLVRLGRSSQHLHALCSHRQSVCANGGNVRNSFSHLRWTMLKLVLVLPSLSTNLSMVTSPSTYTRVLHILPKGGRESQSQGFKKGGEGSKQKWLVYLYVPLGQ